METKIQKQIIDFFTFFEEFCNITKTCLKDCQKYASAINKLINRCRNIKEAELEGSPLGQFADLKGRLCSSMHNLISVEIVDIQNKLSTIEELFGKLCHKQLILQESCQDINFEDNTKLIKGSPLQPPLKQLLSYSEEALTYGSHVCAQISTSLNVLSFKELNTKHLDDNFRLPRELAVKTLEIVAYTSFCSENEI